MQKLDRSISAEPVSPQGGSSPTSTLTPIDSAAAASASKQVWSLFRTSSTQSSSNWQIPTAVLPSHSSQPTPLAAQHAKGSPGPPLQRSTPCPGRTRALEPSTSTKGFAIRHQLDAPGQDQAPQAVAEPANSRASMSQIERRPAAADKPAPRQMGSVPRTNSDLSTPWQQIKSGEGRGGKHETVLGQHMGLFNLGLGRKTPLDLAASARQELLAQPAIHTVKLGRAQPAH